MGKIGGREYWLDAGGRWRSGEPPADWRRDEKGRWHPTKVPAAVRVPEPPAPPEAPAPPRPDEPPATTWLPPIERPVGGPPTTGTIQVKERVRKRAR